MKHLVCTCSFFVFLHISYAQSDWKLIYHNDENGNSLEGDIRELIQAVRDGKEIRMAWGGRRVEHAANADFLTIMKDSVVVGQIRPIYGQTPEFANYTITLKENLEWVLIGGTNGKSDAMMSNKSTGEIVGHNAGNRSFKWFTKSN